MLNTFQRGRTKTRTVWALCSVALVIAYGMSVAFAHAQTETETAPPPSAPSPQMVRVATVNLQDARVSQNGNDFTITFTISNRLGAQPGIQYGVMLVKQTEEGQVVVDHAVSHKVFTLGPGESVERTILYTAPAVPQGTYGLLLVSESQLGFPFGMNFLGTYTLSQQSNGVYIPAERCHLGIEGVDQEFQLNEGVDVTQGETLTLYCLVDNPSSEAITLEPTVITHVRSVFGGTVETEAGTLKPVTLAPGETKEVSLILPKATAPQAYTAVVRFHKTGNAVTPRYVLRGASGTLQNILFDKSSYERSETAQVTVFWTRSADAFRGSREGEGTALENPSVSLMLTGGDGAPCSDPFTRTLEKEIVKLLVPITQECSNFTVSASLVDGEHGALSAVEYQVPIPLSPQAKVVAFVKEEKRTIVLVVASLIALGAVSFLFSLLWKNRKKVVTHPTTMGLLLMSGFFLYAPQVHADSFWAYIEEYPDDNGIYRAILYTVNLDKSSYAPGETMTLTGSGNIQGECSNPCFSFYGAECRARGLWAANIDGTPITPRYIIPLVEGDDAGTSQGEIFYGTATLPAPSDPGPHTVFVEGTATPRDITQIVYGVDLPFMVIPGTPPNVPKVPDLSNPTHQNVTETSAVLGATVVSDGGSPILERGTCWGRVPNPRDNCVPEGGTALGAFSHLRTSLTPRDTIYYRGYARNAVGTGYSSSNAFDTVVLPTVDITVCTRGGSDCVTNGNTKYIYAGEEIVVTWDSRDATSCSRVEGPSDFDVNAVRGNDDTVTEPPFNGTQVFRIECTNGTPREAIVTVITNGEARCTPTEIDGCQLPELTNGDAGGMCASGYRGACEYTCDATNGKWIKESNQCVTPEIVNFVICDKGKNDASCVTEKAVLPSTEVTLRWTTRNTDSCTADRFDTGLRTNGTENVFSSASPDDAVTYRLICEKDGTPSYPAYVTLRTSTNAPEITSSELRVPIGGTVRLSWDTGNGNELSCTLTGGGLRSADTLGNGTGDSETGWADVTISGRSVFTLRCGTMEDTVTVEVIPGVWEE